MTEDNPSPARRYPCPDWLAVRFLEKKSLGFEPFLETILYDPIEGYYGRGREVIGPQGDYITGSTLHPGFARAMARILEQTIESLSSSKPRQIDFVDAGAGSGRFLQNLSAAIRDIAPSLLSCVRFHAIEKSDALREKIRARPIEPAPELHEGCEALPNAMQGVVFSYELFDAIPFARVFGLPDREIGEEVVVFDPGDRTIRVEVDPAPEELRQLLAEDSIVLEEGQEAEIRPALSPLYRTLAQKLEAGIILTFDYGARARALYSPIARFHGTATAHFRHGAHRGLLENPGEQDVTAHLNFSAIERAGEREGAKTVSFVSQAQILLGAGLAADLATNPAADPNRSGLLRLIRLDDMGDDIRVLVQTKNLESPSSLKFLQFNQLRS